MRKYQVIARPVKANYISYGEDYQFVPHLNVFEQSEEPIFTGILDHLERPIYSIPEREPLGFITYKA